MLYPAIRVVSLESIANTSRAVQRKRSRCHRFQRRLRPTLEAVTLWDLKLFGTVRLVIEIYFRENAFDSGAAGEVSALPVPVRCTLHAVLVSRW